MDYSRFSGGSSGSSARSCLNNQRFIPIIERARGTNDGDVPIIEHSIPTIADWRGTTAILLLPNLGPSPSKGHFACLILIVILFLIFIVSPKTKPQLPNLYLPAADPDPRRGATFHSVPFQNSAAPATVSRAGIPADRSAATLTI